MLVVISPSSRFQSHPRMLAPSFEKIVDAARACPLPAPVMIATLFFSLMRFCFYVAALIISVARVRILRIASSLCAPTSG